MRVPSRRELEAMPKHSHLRDTQGQPYTRVEAKRVPKVTTTPDGPIAVAEIVYKIYGVTFEQKLVDEDWQIVAEEHDLGQTATLPVAHEVAEEWRRGLVGEYAIA